MDQLSKYIPLLAGGFPSFSTALPVSASSLQFIGRPGGVQTNSEMTGTLGALCIRVIGQCSPTLRACQKNAQLSPKIGNGSVKNSAGVSRASERPPYVYMCNLSTFMPQLLFFFLDAPPSTTRSCPFTNPAPIKNSTASAMSSGIPALLVG
jgi:hypothetical protein